MKKPPQTPDRASGSGRKHSPAPPTEQTQNAPFRLPDIADLYARLRFTSDGCIWFDEHRMLLIHAKALGTMRNEMIESLGVEVARSLLARMGYQAGIYDAQMARKIRSKVSLSDILAVGPQMHCLNGVGLSVPVRLEFDVAKGKHYGELLWTHSVEDEEQLRYYPIASEPSCWMQVGYASGYMTEFMGRQILYREVECLAMGQNACRIIGMPAEDWGEEGLRDLRYLQPPALHGGPSLSPSPKMASLAVDHDADPGPSQPMGVSPGLNSALHLVRKVAPTQATVLFLGESGVGKEVFARMVHRQSARSDKPFIAVNCAALPEQLIEAELFGVERGAYTGATQDRPGRFERANGATLFLDEIGTLCLSVQGKLLRALQEGEIERLGDSQTRRVDVRVIAATNVDLRKEVAAGRFREDLFFRLNVFPIRIVPLRERREDIPLLLRHFLAKFNRRHGKKITGFTQRAVDAVMVYGWPGNIREIENVVERGVILAADGDAIDATQLFTSEERFESKHYTVARAGVLNETDSSQLLRPSAEDDEVERISRTLGSLLRGGGDPNCNLSLDEIETVLLKRALERANGNVSAAARLLGITRPQMVYRLKSRAILQGNE